jgi:hypothetical protein
MGRTVARDDEAYQASKTGRLLEKCDLIREARERTRLEVLKEVSHVKESVTRRLLVIAAKQETTLVRSRAAVA